MFCHFQNLSHQSQSSYSQWQTLFHIEITGYVYINIIYDTALDSVGQARAWTLENQSTSLEDEGSEFDYRDIRPHCADTLSQHSYESQTAVVRFTLTRGGNIMSHPSHTFVRTPSVRSHRLRTVSEPELANITKEDFADIVEQNMDVDERA